MPLTQITLTSKNGVDYAATELFYTGRIIDYEAKDASNVIFYYKELGHRREKANKYETEMTLSEFDAIFDETSTNDRIRIPITEIYSPSKKTVDKSINVGITDIIKAKDIDTSSCWLWFARGEFQSVKVKVSATISEIETANSGSSPIVT